MSTQPTALELTEIVFPEHTNHYGTLFGGNALLLMSKAAFLAGRAFAGSNVVMASVSDAQFLMPVRVGSVLRLCARVSRVGRTSMSICVTGTAQPLGDAPAVALKALFEMVAVDGDGRPASIPDAYLIKETA